MRITQWGEYGIQFSITLARAEKEGRPVVGAAEVSREQGVDIQYAQQIFQRLRKGGIASSVRGPQGGYKLARPAEEITLKDILVAAEGETFEIICEVRPLGADRCAPTGNCTLRPVWYELKEHIDAFFSKYRLDQLLDMRPMGNEHDMPVQITGARFPIE